jgi:hypothetical protein
MSQNPPPSTSHEDKDHRKLISPLGHVVMLGLSAVFFVFMTTVAYTHTPDFSERGKWVVAAYTSSCISGIFWLVLNCFWVTLVDQLRRKKAGLPR